MRKWYKNGLIASIGSMGLLLLGLSSTPAFASSGPYTGALWTQASSNEGIYSYSNTPSYTGGYGPFIGVEDGVGGSQYLSENVGVGWSPQWGGPDYAYEENNVPGIGNATVLFTTHPTIGTSHAYEIEYLGNSEWGAFIDNQQVVYWNASWPAYSAYAGIDGEGAPVNIATFTGQTNNSLEFLSTVDGSWYDWSGGYIEQAANSSASWVHPYYDETDSAS